MKIKYLLLTLSLALVVTTGFAGSSVNTEDKAMGTVLMEDMMADKATLKAEKQLDRQLLNAEKKQYRAEKRVAWFSKMINKKMAKSKNKSIGGLDDPVDKWFWYWLIAWGAALLVSILFWSLAGAGVGFYSGGWLIAGLLSTLLWLGGTVCFIIWLVNKLG
jgi:hypothetical protein